MNERLYKRRKSLIAPLRGRNCKPEEIPPAPCHLACPTHIDIPSYLALVAHGRYEEALEVIRQDNPFPWVCGLVFPHPCESACMRAFLDNPINIKNLKAFVAEWCMNHASYAPLSNGRGQWS